MFEGGEKCQVQKSANSQNFQVAKTWANLDHHDPKEQGRLVKARWRRKGAEQENLRKASLARRPKSIRNHRRNT